MRRVLLDRLNRFPSFKVVTITNEDIGTMQQTVNLENFPDTDPLQGALQGIANCDGTPYYYGYETVIGVISSLEVKVQIELIIDYASVQAQDHCGLALAHNVQESLICDLSISNGRKAEAYGLIGQISKDMFAHDSPPDMQFSLNPHGSLPLYKLTMRNGSNNRAKDYEFLSHISGYCTHFTECTLDDMDRDVLNMFTGRGDVHYYQPL
ncbi:hypothetical protein CC86DRAFT_382369 [Ophiobolus disseminans]|uniref:Uncharacterized protein n=1 Tax=Ophiobolus disseminans TaxID=1469910 RepID=A0A6A7A181_9PLEO|nr:hypothetical protein CC86DRAFT_382369 [Ophiobolus disseminans]